MTIGLKTSDHVILAVEKKSMKKLQKKHSIKKVAPAPWRETYRLGFVPCWMANPQIKIERETLC